MPPVDAVLVWSDQIDEHHLAVMVLVVGLCSSAVMFRAGLRDEGATRRARLAVSATGVVLGVGLAGQLWGLPSALYWGVGRPLSFATLAAAMAFLPAARRPLRDWMFAAADGWMVVGGVLLIGWMILRDPDLAARGHVHPWFLVILAGDLLAVSVIGGLVARAAPGGRRPLTYLMVAGLCVVCGDMVWAFTGHTQAAVVIWIVGIVLVGAIGLMGHSGTFASTFVPRERGREIRLIQLPLIPSAFFLLGPVTPSVGQSVVAASVVVVCYVNLVVQSHQYGRLVDTVTAQSHRYEALLSDSGDGILQLDAEGRVVFANDAAAHVLGHGVTDMLGRGLPDYVHPEDLEDVVRGASVVGEGHSDVVHLEFRARHGSGVYRHIESTISRSERDGGFVCSTRDVTDRVLLRQELVRQARIDALTGLLNRAAFLELVQERLDAGVETAVLFVDLDDFKGVNDTLGHAAGDDLLRRVGTLLREVTDPEDVLGRLGGDEFAVLTAGRATTATATARTVIGALGSMSPAHDTARPAHDTVSPAHDTARPAHDTARPAHDTARPASASIGIAIGGGGSAVDLLRDADLAMYRAKGSGGGGVAIFEAWMKEHVIERSMTLSRLESAIATDGLAIELQPVVDLGTGGWTGFEALVRWQDGQRRRAPDEFIPLAEESGLVVPLGTWVLNEALRQVATWPDPHAGVAVNVSPRQLENDDFAGAVFEALARTGVTPDRLTLEITEQAAVTDLTRTASRLGPLRRRGVHISVDDFGTGFSSMRYLTRLPVDSLKIDQQFVRALGDSPEDDVLVASMLRLAADLGLEVVAEGIETHRQAQILRGLGCRLAQGFLFSRPRPLAELRDAAPPVATTGRGGLRVPAMRDGAQRVDTDAG